MITDRTAGIVGLSFPHAESTRVVARIAAVLTESSRIASRFCAERRRRINVCGGAITRHFSRDTRTDRPATSGVEMRRLTLVAVIAVTLPTAARAQACLGSVSFATVPVRPGGGAIFGKDYTAYAASLIAGKDNAAFGDVGVSRTYIDGYDDTGDDVFVEFGVQRNMGKVAQLCPVVGASIGTGPDDDGKLKSRFASAGLALGFTLRPAQSVKIIPNGSLRYEYAASDF